MPRIDILLNKINNDEELNIDEIDYLKTLIKCIYDDSSTEKSLDLPYPQNLLYDILGEIYYDTDSIEDMNDRMELLINTLHDKEKTVITERYKNNRTYEYIGRDLGYTRERARQLLIQALIKLRRRKKIIFNSYSIRKEIDSCEKQYLEERKKEYAIQIKEYNSKMDEVKNKIMILNEALSRCEGSLNFILSKNISEIDELSIRTTNCLRRQGYETVRDVCEMKRDEAMNIRNLGSKCFRELEEWMNSEGLFFK